MWEEAPCEAQPNPGVCSSPASADTTASALGVTRLWLGAGLSKRLGTCSVALLGGCCAAPAFHGGSCCNGHQPVALCWVSVCLSRGG